MQAQAREVVCVCAVSLSPCASEVLCVCAWSMETGVYEVECVCTVSPSPCLRSAVCVCDLSLSPVLRGGACVVVKGLGGPFLLPGACGLAPSRPVLTPPRTQTCARARPHAWSKHSTPFCRVTIPRRSNMNGSTRGSDHLGPRPKR